MTVISPSKVDTISDAVADVTARHSEVLFGLMGNGNAFYISSLTSRGFRYLSSRHEAGAVAMADAYHRASGKLATASVTYGAGFSNALTALVEAEKARIPLVLVVGGAPSNGARPWDIDQDAVSAGLGIRSFTVSADRVQVTAEAAYSAALSERRPVILTIPYDLSALPYESSSDDRKALKHDAETSVASRTSPAVVVTETAGGFLSSSADSREIARLLTEAERPLIIAGHGAVVSGAKVALLELGDSLGALFATSARARNFFDSAWDLGIAGGFARSGPISLMRSADVVLVVGASLNAFQARYGTLFGPEARVIQIDERAEATNPQVTDFICGDAKSVVQEVAAQLSLQQAAQHDSGLATFGDSEELTGWRALVPEVAEGALRHDAPSAEFAPDGRLNPRAVAQKLNEILPAERTIVQDGGHFSGWIPMYCDAPDPQGLMMVGTAFQTIGLGIPSAVGAAVARPDRMTVLISGDGGALMALSDLDTAIKAIPSGVMVVFNDAAYGAELHQYAVRGLDPAAMLIEEVDFAAVGKALGAHGIKMRSLADLGALRDWLVDGAKGLFILDVAVSQSVVAEYMEESMAGILADLEN